MKKNEYKCAICLNIYEKDWSDKEAENEVKEIWGEIPQEQRVVICDDCFNKRSPAEIMAVADERNIQAKLDLIMHNQSIIDNKLDKILTKKEREK